MKSPNATGSEGVIGVHCWFVCFERMIVCCGRSGYMTKERCNEVVERKHALSFLF